MISLLMLCFVKNKYFFHDRPKQQLVHNERITFFPNFNMNSFNRFDSQQNNKSMLVTRFFVCLSCHTFNDDYAKYTRPYCCLLHSIIIIIKILLDIFGIDTGAWILLPCCCSEQRKQCNYYVIRFDLY